MGSYIRDFLWAAAITIVIGTPFLILALTLN